MGRKISIYNQWSFHAYSEPTHKGGNMHAFILDVAAGLFTGFLTLVATWQWPLIKSLFDRESRRQAKQIAGQWTARETFADGTHDEFLLEIDCVSGRVTGAHSCMAGVDQKKQFPLVGTYKDQIVNFTWMPRDHSLLESGTVTARLVRDGELDGHGLYIEPTDGKVYASAYSARKEPA
jgi:hypothetical protein